MGTKKTPGDDTGEAVAAMGRGDLDSVLGFHIRLAHGAVYRHFSETFAELGLTQKQVSVLWMAANRPGLSQSDLGQELQMDRATTTDIINRLAARGLLRRVPSAKDRRKTALFLEPEGKALLTKAQKAIDAHESWLKCRFTPAEVDTLIGLLDRIHSQPVPN
ncbi:MAG: MarR family transcriptional regulator [Novosphingobium sp.]